MSKQGISVGQVYRDTYYDGLNECSHRTIQIAKVIGDRLLAVTLTDGFGSQLPKPRKTRLSIKTLIAGYELVMDGGGTP